MKKNIFTILLIIVVIQLQGQEILTTDEALKITLSENYDIKVTEKNIEIAKNNSSIYNSGFLPTANLNGGVNYSNNNTSTEGQDGSVFDIDNATSTNYNASLDLNYVIFDGLSRKYNFAKLKETYNLTELQARQVIETTLLNLYFNYYEVARLTENENNQKQSLQISKRRLLRANYGADYGQKTKLDVLNAEVDVNNDSINYLDSKRQLSNAKRNLNVVMGRDVNITNFEVETTVNYLFGLNIDDLLNDALQNNVIILQVEKGITIGNYDIDINKSGWMPSIIAKGSYNYNKSINDKTFNFANQGYTGFGLGINLGWDVFDGGRTRTRVQNAKIAVESQEIEKEQYAQQLTRDVYNAWEFYQNALFKMQVQEINVQTNERNFERTNEQYKLGQINSIDFRLAQVNLLNAERDLSQSKYDAKNAEYQLLYLAGNLLNN